MNTLSKKKFHSMTFDFRAARAIMTANELGIFRELLNQSKTIDDLSTTLNLIPEKLRILANTLVALKVLRNVETKYSIQPQLIEVFRSSENVCLNDLIYFDSLRWRNWANLPNLIRKQSGSTQDDSINEHVDTESIYNRAMQQGIYDISSRLANFIADHFPNVKNIVDIGGGLGSFAREFLQQKPNCNITIIDNSIQLLNDTSFNSWINSDPRISFRHFDIVNDVIPPTCKRFNVAVVSRLLMGFAYNNNLRILNNVKSLLLHDAVVVVHEFSTDSKVGALMHLDMLANNDRVVCDEEKITSLLKYCGYSVSKKCRISDYTYVLIGTNRK